MLRYAVTVSIALCGFASGAFAQSGCEDERGVKSAEGTKPTKVTFVNQADARMKVYWLDYDGKRQFYADVSSGKNYVQDTYMTHPWVVTDAKGQCVMMFRPVQGATVATIRSLEPVRAAAPAPPPAPASYVVTPVKNAAGVFVGCQATNERSRLSFLAVGDRVLMFAESSKFPFAEADKVEGTWAVDGGAPAAFTSDGGGANMVGMDVPNSAAAVGALTSGKTLQVVAKGISASFDLAGTSDGFSGMLQCLSASSK